MNIEETVDTIIDEAYAFIFDSLTKAGIRFDSSSDDCIFYDNDEQKKTFVIKLFQKQCDEYEGK